MSTQAKRTILMTIALPYANGVIHLGHLVEANSGGHLGTFSKNAGQSLCVCVW